MGFDLRSMLANMGGVAWGVVIVLTIMSVYSIAVMIERYWTYSQATKQSRKYAPEVARLLKQGKLKEAIDISHGVGVKHSHLAKVLVLGLQEWQYQLEMGEVERDKDTAVDAAKRQIQRATAVNLADLKRGLSGLATIGSTAPFVGLFGTTFGIINAFSGMALTGSGGIAAISAGIAEALITTAYGLFVAVPAVWAYNYLGGKVEGFNVEMDNSSSELLDYFIKKGAA
jgi:biopolymer transport protein ExbB/TolQ